MTNQRIEQVRDGEDHMKMMNGQQLLQALLQPPVPGGILALWAMAVPAGIINRLLESATLARLHMPAQGSGPA